MPDPSTYRNLELEHAAQTAVARAETTFGRVLKIGAPLGALGLAGWMIWAGLSKPSGPMTNPDREEFRTTQFPAPDLEFSRAQVDQGRMYVPPPEPAPAPPVAPAPAASLPVTPPIAERPIQQNYNDDAEERRLAELERQRREEAERRRWERLRAPQVVADNTDASMGAARPSGAGDAARPGAAEREEDPNRRFLASAGSAGVETSVATKNNRIDALIAQGTLIRGVLETALQSDLPGMVRAITTEDVWSFDGRRVLIPAGSRLVGEYKSGVAQGQTRVFIVWTRLLRADGVSVQLASIGTDSLGRAGNAGQVDNHYVERFGSAILLSMVGGVAQFIGGLGQSNHNQGQSYTDPTTGQTITIQGNTTLGQARQIGATQTAQTLTNLANEALKNAINIPPTIHLDQGAKIIVFVRRDLDFSLFYLDPVREALRDIKEEMRRPRPVYVPPPSTVAPLPSGKITK